MGSLNKLVENRLGERFFELQQNRSTHDNFSRTARREAALLDAIPSCPFSGFSGFFVDLQNKLHMLAVVNKTFAAVGSLAVVIKIVSSGAASWETKLRNALERIVNAPHIRHQCSKLVEPVNHHKTRTAAFGHIIVLVFLN
jgi:hypothetical protein